MQKRTEENIFKQDASDASMSFRKHKIYIFKFLFRVFGQDDTVHSSMKPIKYLLTNSLKRIQENVVSDRNWMIVNLMYGWNNSVIFFD